MPLGSDLSTRNIQQIHRPKLHNKADRRFAEAIVTRVEKERVKLLREQDKDLVVLLLRMVETKPKSNTLIFDFENKRETSADLITKQVDVGDLQAEQDSTVDTIIHEDDIDGNTVACFIACISPASRFNLPTHDVVEISDAGHQGLLATRIEWSMKELKDLYMFAHAMEDSDVCNMVIDRIHEELHHPWYCLRRSTTGMKAAFKLLGISPAFLNPLSKYEKEGFEFFADVLVTTVEDTLELLRTSGIGSWRHQVKRTLIEKLESNEASEASKNNTAVIYPHYHHHQGSEVGCYKSKVPETLTVVASAMQELPSPPPTPKKQVEPCKSREASEGVHSESNDERPKSRFQKSQQELHDNWNEYEDISDTEILSEDEYCNAIIVRLPEVYSKARGFFRSSTGSYGEPYKHAHVSSGAKQWTQSNRSSYGLKYRDKGMNLVKDTAGVQRKKVAIVKERLQMFRDYGYVSDSGKVRGRLKTMPRLADKDVEMTDEDEGDHRI
ncbi:unnamed protein product [Alternaria alternata]